MKKTHYRTLWLSDIHLGNRDSVARPGVPIGHGEASFVFSKEPPGAGSKNKLSELRAVARVLRTVKITQRRDEMAFSTHKSTDGADAAAGDDAAAGTGDFQ